MDGESAPPTTTTNHAAKSILRGGSVPSAFHLDDIGLVRALTRSRCRARNAESRGDAAICEPMAETIPVIRETCDTDNSATTRDFRTLIGNLSNFKESERARGPAICAP